MGGIKLISIASVMEEHQQWCSSSPPKTFVLVDLPACHGKVVVAAKLIMNHLSSQQTLEN
jgi:hypothetical protein